MPVRAEEAEVLRLLRWGQQLARAGNRYQAQEVFLQVLEIAPRSEEAWLWLAGTSESVDELQRYLRIVLQINPSNARALLGLRDHDAA